jgi:hypothetical protein
MAEPTVTLTLPTAAYDELQERARQHHRQMEEEATGAPLAARVCRPVSLVGDRTALLLPESYRAGACRFRVLLMQRQSRTSQDKNADHSASKQHLTGERLWP